MCEGGGGWILTHQVHLPFTDMVGDDPHFSIALPSGRMLCYTVQGEHGFTFNLISNKKVSMNALFFPDSRREEVTWLGSMGIIVKNIGYRKSNITALRFVSKKNKIYIGDKVVLEARNIEKLTFTGGKLTVSEAPPVEGFKYPSVYVDLHDVGLSFTIKFMNEHLDLFWHSTGHRMDDSHGLIGEQVFALYYSPFSCILWFVLHNITLYIHDYYIVCRAVRSVAGCPGARRGVPVDLARHKGKVHCGGAIVSQGQRTTGPGVRQTAVAI